MVLEGTESRFGRLEKHYGLTLSGPQRQQVRLYLQLLAHWNRRLNLTAIERTERLLQRHFFESFWVAERFLLQEEGLADVGTGAGFPGLAFKLYRPGLAVALLEKNFKKTVFLREVARRLELEVEIFHGEAESYPHWERWRLASLRALKPSRELLRIWREGGQRLLLLHGASLAAGLERWRRLQQRPLPQGAAGYASLLAPPEGPD